MAGDDNERMREFILLAEAYAFSDAEEALNEDVIPVVFEPVVNPLIGELHDMVFRMRSFCETEGGDFGLGVETGMQRCADMIENLIRRHTQGD